MARKRRGIRLSSALPNRKPVETRPRSVPQVGRNDPCPCGSGKKYKACHAATGERYLVKIAKERDRERLQQERARLKAAGVPWYRRLFAKPGAPS